MEPPTATMAICAAESWWRSPSSWNCRGADDSVGMQQHSIGESCGTPRSRRDFCTLSADTRVFECNLLMHRSRTKAPPLSPGRVTVTKESASG